MLPLQAIQDELDSRGHADLVEDAKKVISNDEVARRGFAPRAVAIAAIAATIVSGVVGWIALRYNAEAAVAIIAAYMGLLVATGVGLGSLPLRGARRAQSVRQSYEI